MKKPKPAHMAKNTTAHNNRTPGDHLRSTVTQRSGMDSSRVNYGALILHNIHRIKQNQHGKKARPGRATRAMLGARFRVLCADAGLSVEQTAKVLHVTKRTVQYWISGRVGIPYAAYRLVRILARYELPDPAWQGWIFHSGKLWSPEGHGFLPQDSAWWGRLVSQARLWRESIAREHQFDLLMMRAGRAPAGPPVDARASAGAGPVSGPTGEAGRAAQPPGPNLFLEHFGTRDGFHRGESPISGESTAPEKSHDAESGGGR